MQAKPGHYYDYSGRAKRKIRYFVNHWDVCLNATSCQRVLDRRGISVHFLIDKIHSEVLPEPAPISNILLLSILLNFSIFSRSNKDIILSEVILNPSILIKGFPKFK